ncbi:S-adenosylmethionine-dependent methyltransferase [Aspergillus melleus]|uniref:S-adenosylmethionine-dependent methyltransferase n=1 Tax=Aspergillus melleus TaxID=138277 RepID=UPI001E8DE494|nr:S-adenosylmethionine-dependent methyltransferase [Aspergillus melleus]KAH8427563.1 S-adenosylmethionine-dependent methyltransferase [Aspergillus melleus]
MLPTPCTSHVSFDTIYEPSEDSYLFLDTLSSTSESTWLKERFNASTSSSSDPSTNPSPTTSSPSASPLIIEVGTGSGVVLGFVAGNSHEILGRRDILTLGIDVNRNACLATKETVQKAIQERQADPLPNADPSNPAPNQRTKTIYTSSITSDLLSSIRPASVDILLFNPPYVPTEDLPRIPSATEQDRATEEGLTRSEKFDRESYFLSLTYAGGKDGMETTDRLIEQIPEVLEPTRGVAYVLLCAQNRPGEVRERIRGWGGAWRAEFVGNSGVQAGWEKLVILRVWREGID